MVSALFTPDGATLIVGMTDQFLRFRASDGTPLAPLMVPGSDGYGTLSGDGKVFATTGPSNHVQTLAYPDGAPTTNPASTWTASAIALSRDGSVLAVDNGGVTLVRTSDGTTVQALKGPSYNYSIAFSNDDAYVGAADAALVVWRRSDGNVIYQGGTTLGGATLSPVPPELATGYNGTGAVVIWDYEQGQILRTLNDAAPNLVDILGFSDVGHLSLGVQGVKWRALLYDLAQPQPLSNVTYTYATEPPDWGAPGAYLTGDERYLVGAGDPVAPDQMGNVRIWDTATGTVVRSLPGHAGGIYALALDGRNKRIATAGYEALRTTPGGLDAGISIKLWDQDSGGLLQTFVGHTDYVYEVAFSPDGTELLSGGRDGLVRLWSIADGSVVRDFAGPTDHLTSQSWYGLGVSFSPNGLLIASGGNDLSVRGGATVVNIWSKETGAPVRHLQMPGVLEDGFGAPVVARRSRDRGSRTGGPLRLVRRRPRRVPRPRTSKPTRTMFVCQHRRLNTCSSEAPEEPRRRGRGRLRVAQDGAGLSRFWAPVLRRDGGRREVCRSSCGPPGPKIAPPKVLRGLLQLERRCHDPRRRDQDNDGARPRGAACVGRLRATPYARTTFTSPIRASVRRQTPAARRRSKTRTSGTRSSSMWPPAILLNVTNRRTKVQIEWAAITLTHSDGSVTSLRPDVDLGWLQPRPPPPRPFATALPHSGSEAAAYEGRRFQLNVPAVVRRQSALSLRPHRARARALGVPMRLPLLACLVVVGVTGGCATRYPLPMTAADLVRYDVDAGPALVAYLGQPDASPAVCESAHAGAARFGVHARGSRCADRRVRRREDQWGEAAPLHRRRAQGLPADQVPSLFDDVMRAYGKLLKDSDLETDPALAERREHATPVRRPPTRSRRASKRSGRPSSTICATSWPRTSPGPIAKSSAAEIIATVDVEHGPWQGRPVDPPLMDTLAAAGNEMTLTRFAERLPAPDLQEAKRRIVESTSRCPPSTRCAPPPPPSKSR